MSQLKLVRNQLFSVALPLVSSHVKHSFLAIVLQEYSRSCCLVSNIPSMYSHSCKYRGLDQSWLHIVFASHMAENYNQIIRSSGYKICNRDNGTWMDPTMKEMWGYWHRACCGETILCNNNAVIWFSLLVNCLIFFEGYLPTWCHWVGRVVATK